jgi:hypothetical protein
MSAADNQNRILSLHERQLASLVDDIARIEATSYEGVGVEKVYLHEGADVNRAVSQLASSAFVVLKYMPPNITPPLVLRYGATDVPIIRLSLSSNTLPDTVSRLDAGEAQAERVQFDLAELVLTSAEQLSLLAEDNKITVLCNANQRVTVEGDRARLEQVIVNLLDNAIKNTPNGDVVRLHVARDAGHAIVDVIDNGIGIRVDALPHLFECFFRVDGLRSRDKGGAGLGLPIVKSICTPHGGEIEVIDLPEGRTYFRIRQPLAATASAQRMVVEGAGGS